MNAKLPAKLERLQALRLRAQLQRHTHTQKCQDHHDFFLGKRPEGDCPVVIDLDAKIASLTQQIKEIKELQR